MSRALALLCLVASATSCKMIAKSAPVSIASEPPGARILVDKRDSGFVTPAVLMLDLDETARVELQYPGYVTATRILVPDRLNETVLWRDMHNHSSTWNFPLWLNARDGFAPFTTVRRLSPGRVYVRLERSADA